MMRVDPQDREDIDFLLEREASTVIDCNGLWILRLCRPCLKYGKPLIII